MLVNRENLSQVFINLKTTFNKAFDGAPSNWAQTAMLVPSTGVQNDYAWLDRFPKMREWIGDKVVKALAAQGYTIVNKEWEATVGVRRVDIETDNLGIYAPMAQDAGFSAKQWPDELVAALKNNAFNSLCYDGQYFYDTDHPVKGADGVEQSVSNRGTAVLSNATQAAAADGYGAAHLAIMSFKDDEGRPLGLLPDTLEVPPALATTGRMLMENDKLADDTPNPYKGTAKLLVNPWLTSTTAWFLHVTNRPIKPYIFQRRKAPVFVQQTNMDSDNVFDRGEYKFGAESSGNGGYGLWQMSYGSTGQG
ncbi:Mu-like major head subunit gpT, prophage protein [Desulfosarcina variabilis str. Montpellier]|uniref:Mu-like prophage major head subunit gpT family protein n=1 Tax=Desulfosarcina variabilis TaxID=2300 RepID=UPI003AFA1984